MTESSDKVIIYTLPECEVSDRALAEMRVEGIDFEERNVMRNKDWFNEALAISIFVPILIWPDRGVEVGWKGATG